MSARIVRKSLRDAKRREPMLRILDRTLAAIDPAALVERTLRFENGRLHLPSVTIDVAGKRIWVLAIGKAAAAMARGALTRIGVRRADGLVLTRYGYGADSLPLRILEAGHPAPDQAGASAAAEIEALGQRLGKDDLVLVLLSGGGSALLAAPGGGLTLHELVHTNRELIGCGANIDEINAVRRHLSRLKGGRLMALLHPATVIALILSDVPGNRLESIASGPTVPDPTTYADAVRVLTDYGLRDRLPAAVVKLLDDGQAGRIPETPKPGDPLFERSISLLVGSNETAVSAAVRAAARLGFAVEIAERAMLENAVDAGEALARRALQTRPMNSPHLFVAGGETVVDVQGCGIGGRCQEVAAAAACLLHQTTDVWVAALATDGTDGVSDAAGAIVDGKTYGLARSRGSGLERALDENDTHTALATTGDVLHTGPTGTNVADVYLAFSGHA